MAHQTLHAIGDLVGDPIDTHMNHSQFQCSPQTLTVIEPLIPIHNYVVSVGYPQYFIKSVGNPYWDATMN